MTITVSPDFGPFVRAGTIISAPPAVTGQDSILVVTEDGRAVPIMWSRFGDVSALACGPDGYSGFVYRDPAPLAATQIMVGYCNGRVRVVKFNLNADWPANIPTTFARTPVGMDPDSLVQNVRMAGNLPAGYSINRDGGGA